MKKINYIFIILFSLMIVLPLININFEKDAISLLDNRPLAKNPFSEEKLAEGNLTSNISSYINDRIGFRSEMISAYVLLNDALFNKMAYPNYIYGKEKEIFGQGLNYGTPSDEYLTDFANSVLEMQEYCEERDVPFLFVFEPSKVLIYQDLLPDSLNYENYWVDKFIGMLEDRNIHFVNNVETLMNANNNGEKIFNSKYDTAHWNSLGALYGTNAILKEINELYPEIRENKIEDIEVTKVKKDFIKPLILSIDEEIEEYKFNGDILDLTDKYANDIDLYPDFQDFLYTRNMNIYNESSPCVLSFQGSYLNEKGEKYMSNALPEFIEVHDYQNVYKFPYYFNIFKPDYVIFEAAEYTFQEYYFSQYYMQTMDLKNSLKTELDKCEKVIEGDVIDKNYFNVEIKNNITNISWDPMADIDNAWLILDQDYDTRKIGGTYNVSVHTEVYEQYKDELSMVSLIGDKIVYHKIK